jgi:protein-S-isoprenylcysteine O-methyltransferase Ste14
MKLGYFAFFALFLLALIVRTSYETLKKAGKINPKSAPLFISILLAMLSLWISWFVMCPQDPLRLILPNFVRLIGLGILISGFVMAIGAVIQLKGVENIDHLVTSGFYRKLRHPAYLGFIFWIIGWAIYNGAPLSLIAGFIGIGNFIYWGRLEENHLERTYGDEYMAYRRQTWF